MNTLPAASPISPGTKFFNKYEFSKLIGSGAFGEVWIAKDLALGRDFAVKVLKPGLTIDQRLREAQIGHLFVHNNLVRVHQADVAVDGQVIIAMDYYPDGPVTTLANSSNFLPLPVALRIVTDTLKALEHFHLHNFYHNDIKPQNILRGPQGQAMLSDYGIVAISSTGDPVRPDKWYVLHAAPEATLGLGIDARTDLFQLGLTLFRLIVGLGALEDKFMRMGPSSYASAVSAGKLINRTDFPAFVPSSVRRLILKAVDPTISSRYQSALDMRREIEKLSFSGFWTVDASGAFFGEDARNIYRFDMQAIGSRMNLSCWKASKATGRETRVARYCATGRTKKDVTKLIDDFMSSVVLGVI